MTESIELVSVKEAQRIITARVAQLEQAVAVLGPKTLLGAYLAGTHAVWETFGRFFDLHPAECSRGGPVDCLMQAVVLTSARDPWKQAAADELMTALTGATTIPQMIAWLGAREEAPKEHP